MSGPLINMARKATANGSATRAPKRSFELLVTEFHGVDRETESPIRFKRQALLELQRSVETAFYGFFGDAVTCALHAGRVSVMDKDMDCAFKIGPWKEYQSHKHKYTAAKRKRVSRALHRWISKPAMRRMIMDNSDKVKRINRDAYDAAYRILLMYIFAALDITGVITQAS